MHEVNGGWKWGCLSGVVITIVNCGSQMNCRGGDVVTSSVGRYWFAFGCLYGGNVHQDTVILQKVMFVTGIECM